MTEYFVGSNKLLDDLPQLTRINNEPYVISRNENSELILLDAICPHQGHTVEVESKECLECKGHGWTFDPSTGVSDKPPGKSLTKYPITQRGQNLFVDLPDSSGKIEFTIDENETSRPTISLLSHATLSISYEGFTLLTDPWLDGPAFLGGWTQYPPPTCEIPEVVEETDAIWITHEHSDHLNRRTLSHFPTDIPIYIPELRYRRLSERLTDLGFQNIHTLSKDKPYKIAEGIEAVCFSSDNTFNDSILAVNCGGFRILNLNDAGVNYAVKDKIPTFDLIATSFSGIAGGYPLTWSHVEENKKIEINKNRNQGWLEHCKDVAHLFDADYLLPFAKFFTHLPPEHDKYRQMLRKNRPSDVVNFLSELDVDVLDLLPGETWNSDTGNIKRRRQRERFFDEEFRQSYVRDVYQSRIPIVTEPFELTHEELQEYFENLEGSELAKKVGNHAFTLSLKGSDRTLHCLIRFNNGDINYHATDEPIGYESVDADYHVKMECDGKLVQHVIRNNLSWDEITIGFWGTRERHPHKYNQAFWRLLHAPWEARDDYMRDSSFDIDSPLTDTTMADLIEKEDIEDILLDYGLNCAGCPAGLGEDITEAAKIHGLDQDQAKRLISKVEAKVKSSS
jgi:CMP-N-acetylneuraminate monooxygenase